MKTIKNIYILGTSHVAEQSVKQVKNSIKELKPGIVALELDNNRLYSLKHNLKRPKNLDLLRALGLSGFLFYLFGEFAQKKIGKILRIEPGSEMLTAYDTAVKNKAKIALIDRDIRVTLKRFSKHFKLRHFIKMGFDMLRKPGKKQEINLKEVPSDELIEFVIEEVKKNYPTLYKVLVHERDIYMANKLAALSYMFPEEQILAIVGAGHVKGMSGHLKKILNSN